MQKQKCRYCGSTIRKADDFTTVETDDEKDVPVHKGCAWQAFIGAWDETLLRSRYQVSMAQKGALLLSDHSLHQLQTGIDIWSDDIATMGYAGLDEISDVTPEGFTLYKASTVPFASTGNTTTDLNIEGWISTDKEDAELDTIPPEAFGNASLSDYFARGAPISRDHNTNTSAVGYILKAVLVRDGRVLREVNNSLHERVPFLADYGNMSGFYARGIIDDAATASDIRKGKIRGFSFIGRGRNVEHLPHGGRLVKSIDPLIEVTVASWPVNSDAYMRVVKGLK